MKNFNLPALGAGVGLRHPHFSEILKKRPKFNWFEIIIEDFMLAGGPAHKQFQEIKELYPIIAHSVCLSIGSTDPLDLEYLQNYKNFIKEIKSPWASDHLCFTMIDHDNLNELIPLPFTQETVEHVANRLRIVQDILECPFLIENVTRYLTLSDREMSEAEFINNIIEKSGCGLLLDLTNVEINSIYHNFDAWDFIKQLPLDKVGQIHLSGYKIGSDGMIIDSHDNQVPDNIWHLLRKTLKETGPTSILIERDRDLPSIEELLAEAQNSDKILNEVCS